MSGIGAELPPHLLAKRKRQQEEAAQNRAEATSGATIDGAPHEPNQKRSRVIGPALPPSQPSIRQPSTNQSDTASGPTPQAIARSSEDSGDNDSSDDDDDFGPAPPKAGEAASDLSPTHTASSLYSELTPAEAPSRPQRDEWMTLPPTQDDLASRMDPTRARPRGFNTSKGARGPNTKADPDAPSTWNETAQQKQQRLADEIMGKTPAASATSHAGNNSSITSSRKGNKDHRSKGPAAPSLMDEHRARQRIGEKEADDDPSKRAFDREKDMASGVAGLSGSQKQDLLRKVAGGFKGKFSGGSYL